MIDDQIIGLLIQYGIAGVALYMMYDIANNHLKNINETLIEIKEILKNGS